MFAAVGIILGALLRINRETLDMPDAPVADMMLDSIWGHSMLLQILGALGLLVSLYWVHKAREEKRLNAWRSCMIAAAALAVAPALGGHAMVSEPVIVSLIADVIHVAAGSTWLGTLAVIMMVGISSALKTPDTVRPGERVASMINLFSPIALVCGGTMIATGIISAIFHLPELRSLWTTPYGAALTLKLFFVALLFGAGAWNWRRMKPRLTGDDAIAPMRSSATLELVIAAVVLSITAILVALELP
jgi:copper transport protein